jgi:HAD domain in Swiss Army Knife RNA repair proteins
MIVFLDIDGVLNDHAKLPSNYCGIQMKQVIHLNKLLDDLPDLKIVVSSAWRYLILRGEMTLKGFEMLLLINGVKCYGRLVGHTVADGDICDEPDHFDVEAWKEVGLKMRAAQIKRYLELNPNKAFVVLDDLPLQVENQVQTDPSIGLTVDDIEEAMRILISQ